MAASSWGSAWSLAWGNAWGPVVSGTAITNLFATESPSQYIIDDRTGFRMSVREELVRDGHLKSVMTRSKSRDSYHPQERIGSTSDSGKGPQSPEGTDTFVGTVSVDDL